MSLDLTLLRVVSSKDKYDRLRGVVPDRAIDPKTLAILNDFGRWYRETETEAVDPASFPTYFKLWHPTLTDEQFATYDTLLRNVLTTPADPALEAGLVQRLVAAESALKVAELVQKWNEGDEIDLYYALRTVVEDFEAQSLRKVKTPWVQDNIEDLLADDKNDKGFHWRLDCLNGCMRPLRPGDFGIIAARPDKGKSTFLTSELSFMARQVDEMFPGEMRSVLWFNNEGPGNRIIKRLYQSALNEPLSGLLARQKAGTLRSDYMAETGGRPDTIRVFDIHDFWSHEVEDIFKNFPPAIVVFDMVDNIKFGGAAGNNGQRTDQLLEAMYQWARIMAVKHDCAVLATSQISADGDGLAYPTLSMLKDSKTGKQGAAEFIITIGAANEIELQHSRFIGTTKNKLAREGQPKDPRCEVLFDGDRGRYVMPGE